MQTKHQDELLPSMRYDSEPTASYIESCRMVRFRPAAGDRYSPQQRTMRFNLQDQCWLEPGSVRLQFQLNNLEATILRPIAGVLSMFTSAKLYAGGQLVECVEELGALATILDKLKPSKRRLNDSMMSHVLTDVTGDGDARSDLGGNQSRRCITELPLGLFKSAGKMIPLHLLQGLVVELTLGDALQAIATTPVDAVVVSQKWDISDVSLMASCLHVNSAISVQYHNHLAQGLDMPISFSSVIGTRHISVTNSFTLSLSRSLTHCKQLYFVLVSNEAGNKEVKDFKINVAGVGVNLARDAFTWQVQVGSHRYPDFPVIGAAESYHRLLQAASVANTSDDIAITPAAFVGTGAVFGINFEKLGDQTAFSGINTRGQVLTLTVSNAWDTTTDNNPRTILVYQVYDSILNIRGPSGVDIVD